MKSALAPLAACAFLAAATSAAAQATSEAQQPRQPPAKPATSLDLRLDDPARFSRPPITFGPEEKDAGGLPSLGANARPIGPPPGKLSSPRTSPYPADTNPGR